MKPGARKKYAIYLVLIIGGMLASGALLTGPLRSASDRFTAPVMEKSIEGKTAGEPAHQIEKLYLIITSGVMIYGAHLAARFLSDAEWRKRDYYIREVRWSLLDVLALALLFLALAGLYNTFFPDASGTSGAGEVTSVEEVVAVSVFYLIVLFFGMWILKQKGCSFADGMGLTRRPYGRLLLVGLVAFLGFQPFRLMYTSAVVWLFYNLSLPIEGHPVVEQLSKPDEMSIKLSLVLSVTISAPFFEEIFFRGFLYQAVRRNTNARAAILITAALFASIHPGLFQKSLIFSLGLLLAYLMEKTGSLIPCMVVHFLVNGTSLLLTFLVAR